MFPVSNGPFPTLEGEGTTRTSCLPQQLPYHQTTMNSSRGNDNPATRLKLTFTMRQPQAAHPRLPALCRHYMGLFQYIYSTLRLEEKLLLGLYFCSCVLEGDVVPRTTPLYSSVYNKKHYDCVYLSEDGHLSSSVLSLVFTYVVVRQLLHVVCPVKISGRCRRRISNKTLLTGCF